MSEREKLLARIQKQRRENKIAQLYPDEGPLRRELYKKHMQFFAAGKEHRERLMLAANRVGKSLGVGGYETVQHLTGDYPEWWPGRRFEHPINAWAAGDTSNTVRDILQKEILLGSHGDFGTGLIPKSKIERVTWKRNVPEAVQDIFVKHSSGRTSQLTLKSYDQGRESFQGTAQHLIWLDEEMPLNIYTECLLRTMTTNGIILLTFTPLKGRTEVINMFLPEGAMPDETGIVVVGEPSVSAPEDDKHRI